MVSGSLSLPSRGSFHLSLTVLVHYRSLLSYLALPDGPGWFRQDSSCPALLRCHLSPVSHFEYGALTLSRSPSHVIPLWSSVSFIDDPTTPILRSVWALSLSLAATQKIILIFSSCRYLDVSVPCVSPHHVYVFNMWSMDLTPCGFPHSDIDGSLRAYRFPSHFAVCCVLLRRSVPRHSPYALSCFTF